MLEKLLYVVLAGGILLLFSAPVLASHCAEGFTHGSGNQLGQCVPASGGEGDDGNLSKFFTKPTPGEGTATCGESEDLTPINLAINVNCIDADNPILGYLGGIINFLAGAVGLVVTAMLGIAGVQYMAAQGNPGQIEAARKRVSNAVIAFVTFIFMYAILQWLVPGGIF